MSSLITKKTGGVEGKHIIVTPIEPGYRKKNKN